MLGPAECLLSAVGRVPKGDLLVIPGRVQEVVVSLKDPVTPRMADLGHLDLRGRISHVEDDVNDVREVPMVE